MTDKSIEQEIQAKGLTAPRVTPADIEAEIEQDMFLCAIDGRLTICVLRLKSGFLVTGESAATHADNYDKELGKKIARANAVDKVWPLLGFRLRDKLSPLAPLPGPTLAPATERAPQHIKPTIGRKLWLWPGTDAGDFNVIDGQPLDATITHVRSGRRISVLVVDHLGVTHAIGDVFLWEEGDAVPRGMYAAWAPYQPDQARKA